MTPNSSGRFDNLHNGGNMPRHHSGLGLRGALVIALLSFIAVTVIADQETYQEVEE